MESGFTEERLDSLFSGVKGYRSSTNFRAMMEFCQRIKVLAPYNAMLAYIQRPGAKYLLNEGKWKKLFGRGVKPDSRPILVLIPFGPLEYLFDVDDTYALPDSKFDDKEMGKVIDELSAPYAAQGKVEDSYLQLLLKNLAPYGIAYNPAMVAGRTYCAKIMRLDKKEETLDLTIANKSLKYPANFLLSVNSKAENAERFASIIHELGHYFCRHIPAPKTPKEWWEHRSISFKAEEFEAESISWLICDRLGIKSPSEKYLNGYLDSNSEIPSDISIDVIFKASNDIWKMVTETLPLAKGYLHKFDKDFATKIKALREKHVQQSLFPNL